MELDDTAAFRCVWGASAQGVHGRLKLERCGRLVQDGLQGVEQEGCGKLEQEGVKIRAGGCGKD